MCYIVFFFNDTATTEIYTLSLHDALPIFRRGCAADQRAPGAGARRQSGHRGCTGRRRDDAVARVPGRVRLGTDRKSTRLNSSHANISYAVFCLKKKKKNTTS